MRPTAALCRQHGISEQTLLPLEAEVRRAGAGRGDTAEGPGRGEQPAQTAGRRAGPRQPDPERPPPKKRVTPAERRAAVQWVRERYGLSERRACRLVGDRALDAAVSPARTC